MDLLSTSNAVSHSDPKSSADLFREFLTERRFLKNVTPATLEWYETAWKALQRAQGTEAPALTKSALQQFVVSLRQRDVKPVSCNTYIKALNAFCLWAHTEGYLEACVQLGPLNVEKRILQTLTDEQMQALLSSKPKRFDQWRLHALVCLLLDTGLRIDEALTLRRVDIDFDNLLVTVFGKGRKERRIPFSLELRKVLFRHDRVRAKQCPRSELMFPSRGGTSWDQRNSLRGLHLLQEELRLPRFGWHRLRHTFATNYLRQGGDIVREGCVNSIA